MLMCSQPEPKAFWGYYSSLGSEPIHPRVWSRLKLWTSPLSQHPTWEPDAPVPCAVTSPDSTRNLRLTSGISATYSWLFFSFFKKKRLILALLFTVSYISCPLNCLNCLSGDLPCKTVNCFLNLRCYISLQPTFCPFVLSMEKQA